EAWYPVMLWAQRSTKKIPKHVSERALRRTHVGLSTGLVTAVLSLLGWWGARRSWPCALPSRCRPPHDLATGLAGDSSPVPSCVGALRPVRHLQGPGPPPRTAASPEGGRSPVQWTPIAG